MTKRLTELTESATNVAADCENVQGESGASYQMFFEVKRVDGSTKIVGEIRGMNPQKLEILTEEIELDAER